jgi:hypothetical protein
MNSGLGFAPVNVPESALPYSVEALVDVMRQHNPELQVSAGSVVTLLCDSGER